MPGRSYRIVNNGVTGGSDESHHRMVGHKTVDLESGTI